MGGVWKRDTDITPSAVRGLDRVVEVWRMVGGEWCGVNGIGSDVSSGATSGSGSGGGSRSEGGWPPLEGVISASPRLPFPAYALD